MRKDKTQIDDELDEAAKVYYTLKQQKDAGEHCDEELNAANLVFWNCYLLFEKIECNLLKSQSDNAFNNQVEDILHDVIIYVMRKFDPTRGIFTHLYHKRLEGAKKDFLRAYYKRNMITKEETGERTQNLVSLAGAEEVWTLPSNEPDMETQLVNRDMINYVLHSYVSGALTLRMDGERAASTSKRMWYRLFFTEQTTQICKESIMKIELADKMFQAVDMGYLDFYMVAICRSFDAVRRTAMKAYCEIVPKQTSLAQPPIPFPSDISLTYLETNQPTQTGITKSTRSEFLTSYQAWMRKMADYA